MTLACVTSLRTWSSVRSGYSSSQICKYGGTSLAENNKNAHPRFMQLKIKLAILFDLYGKSKTLFHCMMFLFIRLLVALLSF
jgi:hypothetical protein